jgi:hypothetical protein
MPAKDFIEYNSVKTVQTTSRTLNYISITSEYFLEFAVRRDLRDAGISVNHTSLQLEHTRLYRDQRHKI